MVMKKEDTPRRISRRRYEEKRKAERQANSGNFQTMIPRKEYERICSFMKEHRITKVDLIYAGFAALMNDMEQAKEATK